MTTMRMFKGALLVLALSISTTAGPLRGEEIHDAVRGGDLEKVRSLVEADAALVNLKDGEARTPLHWACLGRTIEIISFLVGKGADLNVLDGRANAPLHYLAGRDNEAGIRLFLEKGADPDILDNGKNAPLHLAAQANAAKAAKALVEGGAKLELRNDYGRTPLLMSARERGGPEMTRLLIEAGANVNAGDRSFSTPLELAAWRGKEAVVDLLLESGAHVPTEGRKAVMFMMFAASQGLEKLFEKLEAGGADMTIRLPKGGTLLHAAAGGDSVLIVEKLLAKGLDVKEKDDLGWTPLHYAALNGRETIAGFLVEKGADKDARNTAGQTAVNVAGEMKQDKVREVLAAAGASRAPVKFPDLRGEWLGQKPPGGKPEVFALGIVSSIWGLHTSVTFAPDGSAALWAPMVRFPGQIYSTGIIYQSTTREGRWTAPEPAPFSGEFDDDVPFFSPDGKRLYFISGRPLPVEGNPRKEAIWYVERQGDGWSEAKALPWAVNKSEMHWQIAVDAAGNVYFGSGMAGGLGQGDLYCAKYSGGRYSEPLNLGPPVSSSGDEGTPYVSPDGRTLIFMKDFDLVVSFKKGDGDWTEPAGLGPAVNSPSIDLCPIVSPDGKYLFFLSQRGGDNQVWWVEAGIIDKLRKDILGR